VIGRAALPRSCSLRSGWLVGERLILPPAEFAPHSRTPSAAGPLFSMTFSLCSGDFGVSPAFSSVGLSVPASSPTSLLSSSAARSSRSLPGGLASWVGARHGVPVRAVREPPLHQIGPLLRFQQPMETLGHQNPADEQAGRLPAYPPSKAFVQRPKWYNGYSPWRLIWSLILILIYPPSTRRLIRLLPRHWLNTARSSTAGAQQSGAAQGRPRIREGVECWRRTRR